MQIIGGDRIFMHEIIGCEKEVDCCFVELFSWTPSSLFFSLCLSEDYTVVLLKEKKKRKKKWFVFFFLICI